MNWSAFPFLRIAFALSTGIFVFEYLNISLHWAFYLLCSATLCYIFVEKVELVGRDKAFICGYFLLAVIFLFGGVLINYRKLKIEKSLWAIQKNEPSTLYGKITQKLKSEKRPKFTFQSNWVKIAFNKPVNFHEEIILVFDANDSIAKNYKTGDYIVVNTELKRIKSPTNPHAFDYSYYLKTKGILLQGYINLRAHKIDLETNENPFTKLARICSDYSVSTFRKYIDDPKILGIAEAILLGQSLLISEDLYQAYSDTGAIHVLSVSGLHVAIFISIFIWMFSKSNRVDLKWKIMKILILLIVVWFYVILTGMAPSVVRAGIMVSIYIIGQNLFKGTSSYNILAIAAIIMLIYNPYYIFQASFQFSYISLLSILYFQPKIKLWWTPKTKAGIFIWDLVNVSLAAQVMIFPVTIYYFHQFPLYFAISGIIAVPLVTVIIYCGTILILFEVLLSGINTFIAPVFKHLILGLNFSIEWISNLPFSKIENIWISDLGLFLLLFFIFIMILWLESRNLKVFYLLLVCFLTITFENRMLHFNASKNHDIIVYDIYGGSIIDILEKKKLKKLEIGNLSQMSIDFATKNNRIKHRVFEDVDSNLYKKNLISVNDNLLYIVTDLEDPNKSLKNKLNVEILIVTKSKNAYPEKLLTKFIPKIVVLDRNLPPWIVEKWLILPDHESFKLHNIKTDGAFVLSEYDKKQ